MKSDRFYALGKLGSKGASKIYTDIDANGSTIRTLNGKFVRGALLGANRELRKAIAEEMLRVEPKASIEPKRKAKKKSSNEAA